MKCRPPFVTPRPGACLDSAAQATVLAKEQVPDVGGLCLLSWPYIHVAPIQELDLDIVGLAYLLGTHQCAIQRAVPASTYRSVPS